MARPKDSKKEIEKLTELVETDLEIVKEPEFTDAEKFIRDLQLSPGEDAIPILIIYYTYCLWRPRDRMKQAPFFKRFIRLFDKKIKSGEVCYMLNNDDEIFDTSLDNKFVARRFMERSRKQFRDAKKTKKK